MSSNRCIFSRSAECIMKLLLSCDEGFIRFFVKSNVSENGSSDERSDLLHLTKQSNTEGSMTSEVVGWLKVTAGVGICPK